MKKNQEKIICAAIHVQDDKKHNSQPKNIDLGYVVCGLRHQNIVSFLIEFDLPYSKEKSTQGFLTNTNFFVDRKKAYDIAIKAIQINDLAPTTYLSGMVSIPHS